jgi:outer membrane immunogenic protein
MKQLLLATTVLALSGPAFAADQPVRMPVKAPIAAPVFSWTGCYLGGHVGAGWGRKDISEPTEEFLQFFAPANSPIGVDTGGGVLGGGQVGCDYQFARNWVIGAAGDFSWASIKGQSIDPFFSGKTGRPITLDAKTDSLASARGRLGYAFDHFMLYGTGGAAWAHDQYDIQNLFFWGSGLSGSTCGTSGFVTFLPCNPQGSETRQGWTVGFGFEWAFVSNWSMLFEFDHYDFGTRTVTLTASNGLGSGGLVPLSGPVEVKQRIDALKFGINYRFGWGGPARY